MMAIGNEVLEDAPTLGKEYRCHRCQRTHEVIDSKPAGMLQSVRCGGDLFLVGIKWKMLPPPSRREEA